MFDRNATYQKSPKGAEAIATRSAALAPKARSMLILVDGKRSFAELARLGQMLGDPERLLQDLSEQGLIEPAGGGERRAAGAASSPGATSPAQAAAAAPAHPPVPLAQAQRFAVRRLTDLLGPSAEDMCMRIEATRNAQEFMAAIQKAEGMLRQFRGAQLADQFATDMRTQRPA